MPTLSAYELQRQENIARNKALLEQLELSEAVAGLGIPKKAKESKAKPIQPAKKKAKLGTPEVAEPRRSSARLRRTVADPSETPAKKRKREQEDEALRRQLEEEKLAAEEAAREAKRPRHYDVDLRILMGEEDETTDMELSALRSSLEVVTRTAHPRRVAKPDAFVFKEDKDDKREQREVEDLKEKLASLKVVARAKVTQDRIYSAAYHPEPTKDLIFFGDKHGQLGIWDARAPADYTIGEDDDEDAADREGGRYWRLQPHWPATSKSSISCVKFDPIDAHSVYTSAYDCTIRHLSFTSGISREVFATGEERLLINAFDMPTSGHEMWVSDTAGGVTHLDLRQDTRRGKGKHMWFQLSDQKVGCVSLNPADSRFLLTASNNRTLKIWDVRKLAGIAVTNLANGKDSLPSPPPTSPMRGSSPAGPSVSASDADEFDQDVIKEFISSKKGHGVLKGEWSHGKSVSSAYFDPSGRRIVSTCYDDTLRLWDIAPTKLSADGSLHSSRPFSQVKHNCQTGRWLTIFKAQWTPNTNVYPHFTIGNMHHSLDIFSCKGDLVARLADPSKLTAVQAVTCSHPNVVERAASGNASGRCVLWAPEDLE